jgi:hypothetical protein
MNLHRHLLLLVTLTAAAATPPRDNRRHLRLRQPKGCAKPASVPDFSAYGVTETFPGSCRQRRVPAR